MKRACLFFPRNRILAVVYGDRGAVLQGLYLDRKTEECFQCECRWKQYPNARIFDGHHPGRLEVGFNCHETGKECSISKYHSENHILFLREHIRASAGS